MDLIPEVLISLVIIGGLVYMFMRQNRERAGNAPLRDEIAARVCFETTLDRASFLGTGGFGGTRGVWIRLRGPKRLTVGTDAFMVSAPQALSEFVFRGSESSIAFGQAVNPDDCIMITGQAGGRQVQLAITGDNLPDIWQALAGTGAAFVLRVVNSESFSGACWNPQLWSTWPSPSSSQAPNPREWVPGLGWRSHRDATPGGLATPAGAEGAREDGDPVVGAGLDEDRLEVILDRVLGQRHLARHRAGVTAGGEQAEQFVFARGETEGPAEQVEAAG